MELQYLKTVVLGLLTLFLFPLYGQDQNHPDIIGLPFIRNFTPQEYRAGIQNWEIAQDQRGVIFVANNHGLLEYDGTQWLTHYTRNGGKMRSIAIDTDGKIYVGCQGDFGFFFPDSEGKLTFTSLADSLSGDFRNIDETWKVFLDKNEIYFCTFSRVYIFNKTINKFKVIDPKILLEHSYFANSELLVKEVGIGLTVRKGDSLRLISGGDFFSDKRISSVLQLSKDQWLVGTFEDGLFKLKSGKVTPLNAEQQKLFKESIVNCIVLLRNGNLAIGTQNNGLLIVNPYGELLLRITKKTILSLFEDNAGNLWIGQTNGIAFVELSSAFSYLNEEVGLPGTGYAAHLEGNLLYVGTNIGLFVKDLRHPNDPFKLIKNSEGQVYHIGNYGGDLLMGHHQGTFRIENSSAIKISDRSGAWIFQEMPGVKPGLLIGGTYNGLQSFGFENGHWKFRSTIKGFNESSRVMEFGKNNELWITHAYKGAFKIDLIQDKISSIHFYNQTKGFPSNNLINVFSLRNDLTFSSEKGIYNYHPDQDFFKPDTFFTNQFKSDEQLWVMKEDLFGNIYFIGKDKVGVLKRNSLGEYSMETNSFNRIAHSLNDDLENLHVLPTNEVLFGSKDGFIHYSPKKANGKKSNFQTLIRRVSTTQDQRDSILSFGNYVEYEKMVGLQPSTMKLKLPYANNSIEFQFSATSYEGTEVHYQYWLENFEKKWSEWNVSTQKEFTNLKEGRYIFHVRARNFEGVISTEATFIFSILAPWYRSLWAMAAYVLLIIAALVGAFFAIDRKYQREQRMMDLKQKKAMIRKQNEIEKMTQQSQDEINRLQNEKLESELMHIHKQLGMSTFHLLNKNEFMSVLKSNLNNIIKKETALASKKELTGIVKNIEENILADTDWKQFQMHFDKVHGDFCRNFKIKHPELSPQEIKLGAYLKMNLSTKEIAQLLHISVRGVEISRYRLRKKLHLERSVNLQDYILGFN